MKKSLTFYSALFILFLIIQRGAGVLTKMVVAHSISPYEYGIITLVAISLPGMLQLATTLNFYYLLSHAGEGKKYFGFSLAYSLIITLVIAILLIIFNDSFFRYLNLPVDNWKLLYFVIIVSLLPLSITTDFQGLFTGLRVYSFPGIILALPSLSRLVILIYLFYFNLISFKIIILVFALSNVIPLVFIFLSKKYISDFGFMKTINLPSRKMFVFSSALFIVSSFSTIGQNLIKFVLSHELGVDWQGYFDVSLTITSIMMFALGTMSFVSIPEATNSDKNEISRKGGLEDVTRGLFSMLLFFLIILYFYSGYITEKLFSAEYMFGSKYVIILAVSYPFVFIQMFLVNLNLAYSKNIREYILPAILTLILIPFFFFLTKFSIGFFKEIGYGNGFIGAYISYTFLMILYTSLTIYCSKDLTPLKIIFFKIERLIISFFLTFLFIYYFNPPALVGMFISAIIFTFLILFLGYLKKSTFLEIFKSHN